MNYIFLTQRNAPAAVCIDEGFSLKNKPPDEADGEMTAILLFNFYFICIHIYREILTTCE
jgi:hypothetical protein